MIARQKAKKLAALLTPPRAQRLVHSTDESLGIRRVRKGSGFAYITGKGKSVRDPAALRRIRSLAIPPAWTDVWICKRPNGHLQATGRDARGRKQYRYHPHWRELRDRNKYDKLAQVAGVLPRLRRRVGRDLKQRGMTKPRVLATVVRALETTLIRVGNEEYARSNGSYGLTTLHNGHAKVRGDTVRFSFRGKSGKHHVVESNDAVLSKIVKRCQELPGRELFGYLDDEGKPHDVTSTDVNDYLRGATGEDITAKDFRTWAGTVLAARHLHQIAAKEKARPTKRAIDKVVEAVAKELGNTKAVCRNSYIHPAVFDAFLSGSLVKTYLRARNHAARNAGLRFDEAVLKELL
jgi:DNA topoisomerase I